MAVYDSFSPVLGKETIGFKRKEGRKWVAFDAEVVWLHVTSARSEYLRVNTRHFVRHGQQYTDTFGFCDALASGARVMGETAGDGRFLASAVKLELILKAKSSAVPVILDVSSAGLAFSAMRAPLTRYSTVPDDWIVASTNRPVAEKTLTAEVQVWSSLSAAAENARTVAAFIEREKSLGMHAAPYSAPETEEVAAELSAPRMA